MHCARTSWINNVGIRNFRDEVERLPLFTQYLHGKPNTRFAPSSLDPHCVATPLNVVYICTILVVGTQPHICKHKPRISVNVLLT